MPQPQDFVGSIFNEAWTPPAGSAPEAEAASSQAQGAKYRSCRTPAATAVTVAADSAPPASDNDEPATFRSLSIQTTHAEDEEDEEDEEYEENEEDEENEEELPTYRSLRAEPAALAVGGARAPQSTNHVGVKKDPLPTAVASAGCGGSRERGPRAGRRLRGRGGAIVRPGDAVPA